VELNEDSKLDVLKHLHLVIRDEIKHMRDRQDKIFTWTSYILLLVIGTLLVIDQSKMPLWANQGILGKIIASAAILFIVVFSVGWLQQNRNNQEDASATQQKIEELLHCFDEVYFGLKSGDMLYPKDWEKQSAHHRSMSFLKRVIQTNYVSATLFLGLLAILMVWIAYI
jgi:hypothetical protein